MDAIVINLPQAKERWSNIQKKMNSHFSLTRIDGVINPIKFAGCSFAHINAARKGLENKDFCLVFEDDAEFISEDSAIEFKLKIEELQKWNNFDFVVFANAECDSDVRPEISYVEKWIDVAKTNVDSFVSILDHTEKIVGMTAVLYSKRSLPLLKEYENYLKTAKHPIITIDRLMFQNHLYSFMWNKPVVWIPTKQYLRQRTGYSYNGNNIMFFTWKFTAQVLDDLQKRSKEIAFYESSLNIKKIPFVYCKKYDYQFFFEMIESLGPHEIIHDFDNLDEESESRDIIVMKYIPKDICCFKKVYLYNTEQLTRFDYFSELIDNINKSGFTNKNLEIYDYSSFNCKIWKDYGFSCKVKSTHNKKEVYHLRELIEEQQNLTKQYDFAFCGTPSKRRSEILKILIGRGYKILNVTGLWGKERDKLISSCNSLLNIHFSEDYKIFEKPRCSRWIKAGFPVLSERSIEEEEECNLFDINNLPTVKICLKPRKEDISVKVS